MSSFILYFFLRARHRLAIRVSLLLLSCILTTFFLLFMVSFSTSDSSCLTYLWRNPRRYLTFIEQSVIFLKRLSVISALRLVNTWKKVGSIEKFIANISNVEVKCLESHEILLKLSDKLLFCAADFSFLTRVL